MRIERLRAAYPIDVVWTLFPLHPETPPEGRSLRDLFGGREAEVAAAQRRLRHLAEQEGLPFGEREMTWNSRLAQELAKWAETKPGGEAIHDALFRAYFVEGLNISSAAVLVEIAQQKSLPADEAREVLESRSFSPAVDADWQRAARMGVTAVPTFVAGRHAVIGAQPYEILERLILTASQLPD